MTYNKTKGGGNTYGSQESQQTRPDKGGIVRNWGVVWEKWLHPEGCISHALQAPVLVTHRCTRHTDLSDLIRPTH